MSHTEDDADQIGERLTVWMQDDARRPVEIASLAAEVRRRSLRARRRRATATITTCAAAIAVACGILVSTPIIGGGEEAVEVNAQIGTNLPGSTSRSCEVDPVPSGYRAAPVGFKSLLAPTEWLLVGPTNSAQVESFYGFSPTTPKRRLWLETRPPDSQPLGGKATANEVASEVTGMYTMYTTERNAPDLHLDDIMFAQIDFGGGAIAYRRDVYFSVDRGPIYRAMMIYWLQGGAEYALRAMTLDSDWGAFSPVLQVAIDGARPC